MRHTLTNWLGNRLPPKRPPDRIITHSEAEGPYMLRWFLIPRNRWFNIYCHEYHRDDDARAPHDHPWWSLSWVLRGVLREILGREGKTRRLLQAGDIVWRKAEDAHRIEIAGDWVAPVTLFITGPRLREWGFWCPGGRWVHWKQFTDPADVGKIGKGCE